ncbi:MAG: YtxH domain-containing protein [Calditrichia bacterium]
MSDRGALEFIKGLIVGGALGAVAALLYAPQSGKEMREELGGKAGDLYDRARREYDDQLVRARENYDAAKARIADLEASASHFRGDLEENLSETGEKLRETGEKFRNVAGEGKKTVAEGASRLKDALGAAKSAYLKEKQGDDAPAENGAEEPAAAKKPAAKRTRKTKKSDD